MQKKEMKSLPDNVPTIIPKKMNTGEKYMLPEKQEIHTEGLQILSEILKEDASPTLSLLDNSAQRLANLMHSQFEQIENDYLEGKELLRKISYEDTQNIATLAKEVRECIKLKVDIIRLKKELVKDLVLNK